SGRFTFKKLAAATYTVSVYQAGRGEARRTIEVGPGLADSSNRIQLTIALKDADFDPTGDRTRHAVTVRELAIELAPQFATAWNTLGTIAYQTRRFPLAEQRCRQALKQDPGAYDPLVNLGGVLV